VPKSKRPKALIHPAGCLSQGVKCANKSKWHAALIHNATNTKRVSPILAYDTRVTQIEVHIATIIRTRRRTTPEEAAIARTEDRAIAFL